MVNQYLVELDLPRVLTPDFANLIPAQRATVNRLLHNGDIVHVWGISSSTYGAARVSPCREKVAH